MADITNVFVSYAHSDAIVANEIVEQLTFLAGKGSGRASLRCFLDSESIQAGQRFEPILKAALEQTDWLIVVFTGNLSPYCGYELGIYSVLGPEERSVVCLHEVGNKLPAMLYGYRTVEISQLSPPTSYDVVPSEKEVDLWSESSVGKFLREFCDRTDLYTIKHRLDPSDYAVDIARAAQRIAGSFQLASQDDEVSEISLQPAFDITIRSSFDSKPEGIPENSVLIASHQVLDVFGLTPPLSLDARPQITWGELRHALSRGREDTSWMDQLEISIDRATSGLAPETDDITFRGSRDDRTYRAILTQRKLLKNGDQRFSVLLSGTSTTAESSHPPKESPFLYATNRKRSFDETCFSGERADEICYGTASVQIPDAHKMGAVELPFKLTLFSLTLYEQAPNPQRHFIIKSVDVRPVNEWRNLISSSDKSNALVFVHGFNTTFRDAIHRAGQIFWDLQYSGIPIMFSWPSRGAVLDYIYDRDSALGARDAFIEVLRNLRLAGVNRIDILAHSMGNLVVLDSLASHRHADDPLGISEILMAAPDLDKDHYKSIVAKVRTAASGMTLYASSADRALAASKRIAGNIARAGDVPESGPILVEGIDAIDVTAIGEELFGLGHSPYATRSILNDIALLITKGIRPPNERLIEIRGMPIGGLPPSWWRYNC